MEVERDHLEVYRRSQVFVVGGQPTITYNPRPEQGLRGRFEDYLEERGRILFLTGPTKAGKTVLVREVLPKAVRVSGGEVSSVEDFWADIVDSLAVYTDESAEWNKGASAQEGNAFGAAAKVGGSGVDAKHEQVEGTEQGRRYVQSRARDPRRVAKQELLKTRPAVVVDDFHHVDPGVQRQIVRGVKDLVFEGVPVIFIAVPHRAADIVRAEREMAQRVEQLQINSWSQSELEEIARAGFDALNLDCPSELADEMAQESYGSPHLMQDFCLQICKANEIRETVPERQVLISTNLEGWFRDLAAREGTDESFRKLSQGPRQRTDRKQRLLKKGGETDIYGAVLQAIAWTGPKAELDWTEVRVALRDVLAEEPPQRHEYTRVLEQMSEIARAMMWDKENKRYVGDPVLEFDSDLGTLHISDPFFAFQLRWAIRPTNGQ